MYDEVENKKNKMRTTVVCPSLAEHCDSAVARVHRKLAVINERERYSGTAAAAPVATDIARVNNKKTNSLRRRRGSAIKRCIRE